LVLTPTSAAPFPYTTLFRSRCARRADLDRHPARVHCRVHRRARAALYASRRAASVPRAVRAGDVRARCVDLLRHDELPTGRYLVDRESTRLNSSHVKTSYAV